MTRVGGVVVTFHPDAHFASRLEAVAHETQPLLVVDNSADAAINAQVAAACRHVGAEFIASTANVGLGAALNLAFAQLSGRGVEWAIAFDQDSIPYPGFTAALLTTAECGAAVVGANWRDEARPEHPAKHLRPHGLPPWFRRTPADQDLADVTCVITSGSLFHLPTWRKLGGFDSGLFLDLVDTDYCLRALRAGYPIAVAAHARLRHRRGSKRPVAFAGRTWWPAFMPPLRLRILFRNRVRLFRRYGWHVPHWVAFELVYAAKIASEITLLEDRKLAKLAACVRGTWDGLLSRNGRPAGE